MKFSIVARIFSLPSNVGSGDYLRKLRHELKRIHVGSCESSRQGRKNLKLLEQEREKRMLFQVVPSRRTVTLTTHLTLGSRETRSISFFFFY